MRHAARHLDHDGLGHLGRNHLSDLFVPVFSAVSAMVYFFRLLRFLLGFRIGGRISSRSCRTVIMRALIAPQQPVLLEPVGLSHADLKLQAEHLLRRIAQPAASAPRCPVLELCRLSSRSVSYHCSRLTHLAVGSGSFVRRQAHRLGRHLRTRRLPSRTGSCPDESPATHCSGAPFPFPIRVSAGFFVIGLSGNNRIQILPPRLMNRVIAIRAASICRSVIQPQRMAFSP